MLYNHAWSRLGPLCLWQEGGDSGHLPNPKQIVVLPSWAAAGPSKGWSCAHRVLSGAGTSLSWVREPSLALGATLLVLLSSTGSWQHPWQDVAYSPSYPCTQGYYCSS